MIKIISPILVAIVHTKVLVAVLLATALYVRFRKRAYRLWRAARHAVWTFKVLGWED